MPGARCCDPGFAPDGSSSGNCTDVDECAEDPLSACRFGRCLNTEGGHECVCEGEGMEPVVGEDGGVRGCVDRRAGGCYLQRNVTSNSLPACGGPVAVSVSRSACCCSVGVAWGRRCQECPAPGSEEHGRICPGGGGFQPNR